MADTPTYDTLLTTLHEIQTTQGALRGDLLAVAKESGAHFDMVQEHLDRIETKMHGLAGMMAFLHGKRLR